MKLTKIIATILIIGSGLLGSYFIIKNSVPNAEIKENSNSIKEIIDKTITENPLKLTKEGILGNKTNESNNIVPVQKSTTDNKKADNNFTGMLSQIVFEELKNKNKDGLTQKDGQTAIFAANKDVVSQELLNKFLSANTSNDVSSPYHPKVDETRFSISQDISKNNQIQYIKNLEKISQENLSGFNKTTTEILNEIVEEKDPSSAKKLADIYGSIADDYYKVSIPANWVDFHKATLSHFYSAQSLWESIANFQNDPLKAYLAAQFISNIEESAKGVQVLLGRGILKNNLSLK